MVEPLHYMACLICKLPTIDYTMHSNAYSHIIWAFKLRTALQYANRMQ